MALTKKDLSEIRGIVGESEARVVQKIDEKVDTAVRDVVSDITGVITEGHNMIGERFDALDRKLDRVRRAWQE